MKIKLTIISTIILMAIMFFSASSYAVSLTSANISINPSKTEYQKNETIEFIVSMKDLVASNGIMGFGAYIQYDSNILTLNKDSNGNAVAEGLSGWMDADISEKTNRFITTKNSHSSNNEDILKIKFTVKNITADVTTSISLNKIEISNGAEITINEVKSSNITIKNESSTSQTEQPGNQGNQGETGNQGGTGNQGNSGNQGSQGNSNNQNNNGQQGNNGNDQTNPSTPDNNNSEEQPDTDNIESNDANGVDEYDSSLRYDNSNTLNNKNKEDANQKDGKIPQLGVHGYLAIVIVIVGIIAIILYIKIKSINKKNKN